MSLSSYDRLFPSQDVRQTGGLGNLIAAPLQGQRRRSGTTVFLDLATLEPRDDQWAYLSSIGRITPREANRLTQRLGQITVGAAVDRLRAATSTNIKVLAPAIVHARFAARITVDGADLPPALMATLKHAATMPNPIFLERQRRRASTWDTSCGDGPTSNWIHRRDNGRRPHPAVCRPHIRRRTRRPVLDG
jgi:hypothetical protein